MQEYSSVPHFNYICEKELESGDTVGVAVYSIRDVPKNLPPEIIGNFC